MVMNKKGIIFSLIAIGLAGLFILLFSSGFTEQIDNKNEIVRTRVMNLDDTITAFYTYATAAQQVAGQEALIALYKEINDTGVFLPDFEDNFTRCMNDSDGCANPNPLTEFLDNYTQAVKQTKDADLTYMVTNITIASESYWSLTLNTTITITMTDRYAHWNYNKSIRTRVHTIGTYDPAFVNLSNQYNNFGQRVERRIASSPFNKEYTIDLKTFMDFYTIGQYQYSQNGSCLSQRYEGDFTNPTNPCGIESVLNPDDFATLPPGTGHMDWQALRGITYPCSDRYNITSVNPALSLSTNDTTSYSLLPPDSIRCN